MADDDTANLSSGEDQTVSPPLPTPDSDPSAPASVNGREIEKEDPDSSRDSKRRKMCPKALEKIEEFVPPSRTFSFTFDTKSCACGPDVTPKFGSFHSVEESSTPKDLPCQIPPEILEIKDGGEEETEVLGVFKVVEGVELDERQFPT